MATSDVFQYATPVPIPIPPLTNVTPFTYRDGTTYEEMLASITYYLQNTLIPEVNAVIVTAQNNLNSGIANINNVESTWSSNMNSFMTDVQSQLAALNDAAMGSLIDNPTSATSEALSALYAAKSAVDALNTLTTTGSLSQSALDARYVLDTQYTADQATLNTEVKALPTFWAPNTHYVASSQVITPAGDIVTALYDHTSGSAYDETHWTGNFGYLVANFGNNVSPAFEKLNVHYSADGKYVAAGENNPVYTPASTNTSGLRDPSVKYYNGRWYCVYTINSGVNKTIEIAVSDDLVNWTLNCTIDLSSVVNTNAWAPEFTVDDDGSMLIHFTNVNQNVNPSTHTTWWIRSENSTLTAWTAPTQQQYANLSAPRPIDPTLIKANGTWHIFYGNDGSIEHATATTATGVWTVVGTGNWANWYTDSPANSTIHYEGPEIVQAGPSLWRIYFDQYTGATAPYTTVGYFWSETSDFVNWTTPKMAVRSPGYPDGYALRHGAWVKLPSSLKQEQVLAATSAGGPQKIHHAEFYSANGTVAGQVYGAGGQVLTNDPGKSSADWKDWVSLSGTTLTFLQNGEYSIEVVAPNTDVDMHLLGAGSWIALKGPLPNSAASKIYASQDAPQTAAAHTVTMTNRWLVSGDQVTVEVQTANAMPSDWSFLVVVSKK